MEVFFCLVAPTMRSMYGLALARFVHEISESWTLMEVRETHSQHIVHSNSQAVRKGGQFFRANHIGEVGGLRAVLSCATRARRRRRRLSSRLSDHDSWGVRDE